MGNEIKERLMGSLPSNEELMTKIMGVKITETKNKKDGLEVKYISPDDIIAHPKNVYSVADGAEMDELIDTIKDSGIHTPLLLTSEYGDMNLHGKYMCISGHRRLYAAKKMGLEEVPAIIEKMSVDDADILLVSMNSQRENVLPSEKAKAYLLRYEALKHQGKKGDSTLDDSKLTASEVSDIDSAAQVRRYIRLNYLLPEWLDAVDNSVIKEKSKMQLAFTIAVKLSYFSETVQRWIYQCCDSHNCSLTNEHLDTLDGIGDSIDLDMIDVIFRGINDKKKKSDTSQCSFFTKSLMRKTDYLFPNPAEFNTPESREEIISIAVKEYFERMGVDDA